MGILVGIAGFSGTGKSSSIRTLLNNDLRFDEDTVIIRVLSKPLPFRNKLKPFDKDTKKGDYLMLDNGTQIAGAIQGLNKMGKKRIIIDDSTFIMVKKFMDTIQEKGFTRFEELAKQYYDVLKAAEETSEDCRVYMINHLDESQFGRLTFRTIGKLISEKVDIPAMMTIVLQSLKNDDGYWFLTNKRTDDDVAKSPIDMFNKLLIPNDLKLIDDTIKDYYGLK